MVAYRACIRTGCKGQANSGRVWSKAAESRVGSAHVMTLSNGEGVWSSQGLGELDMTDLTVFRVEVKVVRGRAGWVQMGEAVVGAGGALSSDGSRTKETSLSR